MKKIITTITLASLFICSATWASIIVDVFGVDEQTAARIKQIYAAQVRSIEGAKIRAISSLENDEDYNPKKTEEIISKQQKLINSIQNKYDFAFVEFHTISYPNNEDAYTTIDIVTKDDLHRLKFINEHTDKDYSQSNDIIQKMIEFQTIAMGIAMNNELPKTDSKCPVYHCITSFSHPQLQPYLKIFNTASSKEKKLILKTLKTDPNPERRGAAIFLLGHFKNPKEIIKLLIPKVNDENVLVRNNAMRVLGSTIASAKLYNIDAQPFITQLDSPYVTDRNKALYVLSELMQSEKAKKQILANAKEKLVKILYLKQPNNHDFAYAILKNISEQNYDDTNFKEWTKWAKSSSVA